VEQKILEALERDQRSDQLPELINGHLDGGYLLSD
jgi:hypothetical protein